MDLIEIVRNVQRGDHNKKYEYAKQIFDLYKDYFLKQFTLHSPYKDSGDTIDFAVTLGNEFFGIITTRLNNFRLKRSYSREELDLHLWRYFKTIADSLLDRTLIILSVNGSSPELKERARKKIIKKYYNPALDQFTGLLQNCETEETGKMSLFEQEQHLLEESRELTDRFFTARFSKIAAYFEKHSNTIFRNYLETGVQNFFIDYIREKNARKMKRLTLYRDDLPEDLFDRLKDLKGYGTLFYYKKKYDCLTIRDTGKAISVIKSLDLPGIHMEDIKGLFKKSGHRAEYQRIIDNITGYIKERCSAPKCPDRLLPKYIKALLYMNDYVMQKILNFSALTLEKARRRMEKCVDCLDIEMKDFTGW